MVVVCFHPVALQARKLKENVLCLVECVQQPSHIRMCIQYIVVILGYKLDMKQKDNTL